MNSTIAVLKVLLLSQLLVFVFTLQLTRDNDKLLTEVPAAYREKCADMLNGKARTFGQAFQDWVVYHNFFKKLAKPYRGIYIDVGTNHPTMISNTVFFDKCLGWQGLCIEPQERYHDLIKRERSCTLVPHCVLGRERSVDFSGSGGERQAVVKVDGAGTCKAFLDVVQQHNITRIDFLSIDIEKSEPDVLRCLPFEEIHIGLVLIETNKAHLRETDLFFHRHGYSNVETFLNVLSNDTTNYWLDNLYQKRRHYSYPSTAAECSTEEVIHRQSWCADWQEWKSGPTDWGVCKGV